jgi:hypothetical protein
VSVVSEQELYQKIVFHAQVYEVAPSLFMVDARKASGETLEYHEVNSLKSWKISPAI